MGAGCGRCDGRNLVCGVPAGHAVIVEVPGLPPAAVAALRSWAAGNHRVARLVVFGSRARGDHAKDSDLDLAIDLTEDRHDTAAGLWVFSRKDWNRQLSDELGLDVRLVRVTDDDDGGIRRGLAADGIEVYRLP
jgi:predicted nucleotidyltransferase